MRKSHETVIEHGDKLATVRVACQGKACPLCASTTENRARISFVAAR